MSFLYKSHFHYTCDSGGRKGNNFAAGDLKSLSDFTVDCYTIHCHIHVIFHKCLRFFTYFLTSLNIKYPSVLQIPEKAQS